MMIQVLYENLVCSASAGLPEDQSPAQRCLKRAKTIIKNFQLKLSFNKKQNNTKLTHSPAILHYLLSCCCSCCHPYWISPFKPDCSVTILVEFIYSFLAAIDVNICSCMTDIKVCSHGNATACFGNCSTLQEVS